MRPSYARESMFWCQCDCPTKSMITSTPFPPVVFFTNDFPSDAGDVLRSLQRHSKDARCRHLASMLSMCNRAVKEEVALLPKTWQQHVPPVDDLLALFNDTAFREGPLGGSMEGVFLTIFQLGCIIA